MAIQFCGNSIDLNSGGCDGNSTAIIVDGLIVPLSAFNFTLDAVDKVLMTAISILDPTTGAYPVEGSGYYPRSFEFAKSSVYFSTTQNSGDIGLDTFSHNLNGLVIPSSICPDGKSMANYLKSTKFVAIVKYQVDSGNNPECKYNVYGAQKGMMANFTEVGSSGEFQGFSLNSEDGIDEASVYGFNYFDTDLATTDANYSGRFAPAP